MYSNLWLLRLGETINGTMDQDFRKQNHANSMKTSPMQTVAFEDNLLSNQQQQDNSAHHMPYNEGNFSMILFN